MNSWKSYKLKIRISMHQCNGTKCIKININQYKCWRMSSLFDFNTINDHAMIIVTENDFKQLPFWILNSGFYSIVCEAYLKVPMLFFRPSIHFIVDDMIKTLTLDCCSFPGHCLIFFRANWLASLTWVR